VLVIGTTISHYRIVEKKNGRPERAEAFAAGYREAELKGACTGLIEVLKSESQKEYVSPYEIVCAILFSLR
jgi:hypothetical protein